MSEHPHIGENNMGIRGDVSEVCRSGGDLCVDWKIPRFLDLPGGCTDQYDSPRFGFYDARWFLRVYPNRWPDRLSPGMVSLSLWRDDDDDAGPSARTVIVSWGVRGSGGVVEKRTEEEELTIWKSGGCYLGHICKRSDLREQKDRLMPGEALTVRCVVKVPSTGASSSPDVPITTNTQTGEPNARTCKCELLDKQGIEKKVLEDMGKLLDSGNKSDVTVQVQEAEFRVHSSILCARSPVLSAMLEHDTLERASHRINIEDCRPEVFGEYLRYLYTGSVKSLSHQTVFGLYRVADQYLADDLKLLCLQHIQDTLCVQTFCDTVTLAVTHGESDLLQLAIDFAAENIQPILRSVEWQNFMCEHPREANEILIKSVRPQT